MSADVVINGRVLLLPMNGIPRYAHEIIKRLDKGAARKLQIEVVIPESAKLEEDYQNILVVNLPAGKAWDFTRAEQYARKQNALYVNLASKGVLYRNSAVTLHDIRPILFKDGDMSLRGLMVKAKVGLAAWLAAHNAKQLVTDSEFSRQEILRCFGKRKSEIAIIGTGWEHMLEREADMSVFEAFPQLKKGQYLLSVSSIAPHKNFKWIVDNAKANPEQQYVIVGKTDTKLWADSTEDFVGNTVYTGFLTDECMKALLLNAKGFIFPSLYEGFGIPPLESLALGLRVAVSDIPVMQEIFGSTVNYFDPHNAQVDIDCVFTNGCSDAEVVLNRYTWDRAAEQWEALMMKLRG